MNKKLINKKIVSFTILTMLLSSLNISFANDDDLNSLLNNLSSTSSGNTSSGNTSNGNTSNGNTSNLDTDIFGIGDSKSENKEKSPILEDIKEDIIVDGNTFKQTIKNNYLLKFKVNKNGGVDDIFSVKYTDDFGYDVTVSGKDIVKEFDIKVVRKDKSELSLAKGTLKEVKNQDELLITPTSTSLILNKQLTFILNSNITPIEYGIIDPETNLYKKLGDYKINKSVKNITESPKKTVITDELQKTGPIENTLIAILLLLGILFYMRKNKIII